MKNLKNESQEFLEMQCYAAIGRFVKEFEFLTSMIRTFLRPCLFKLNWTEQRVNSRFAKLPTGELIKLMKKYEDAFPNDQKGHAALQNFKSVLEEINKGRVQLLHGYPIVDNEVGSFTTTKDYEREKGKIESVTLRHTPQNLDQWEKTMAVMSHELWRAMKNIRSGKSIHKSLLTGNLNDFSLPELGSSDF